MKDPISNPTVATTNHSNRVIWKIVQGLVWLVGIAILLFMIFLPPVGVILFWNILIPVAPALLVVGTGLWRNVCPLGTTALLPARLGMSKNIAITNPQRRVFNLIAVLALFVIIPLRHVIFNSNGQATALLIIGVATVAVLSGFYFERKSGWCSGLCPIHQVERLYGSGVAFSMPNLHCSSCVRCSEPCPDSTANIRAVDVKKSTLSTVQQYLLVGAFPGYVWGWFQLPDFKGPLTWENIGLVYAYPFLGSIVTMFAYHVLKSRITNENRLISLFAATAVSCYYWYRLPQLFGFTSLDTNGVLIDLHTYLPSWTAILLNALTTTFFVWWMTIRRKPARSWLVRPVFAR